MMVPHGGSPSLSDERSRGGRRQLRGPGESVTPRPKAMTAVAGRGLSRWRLPWGGAAGEAWQEGGVGDPSGDRHGRKREEWRGDWKSRGTPMVVTLSGGPQGRSRRAGSGEGGRSGSTSCEPAHMLQPLSLSRVGGGVGRGTRERLRPALSSLPERTRGKIRFAFGSLLPLDLLHQIVYL